MLNNKTLYKMFYDPKELLKVSKFIKNNKHLIESKIKNQTIEHYTPSATPGIDEKVIEEITAGILIVWMIAFVIALILWVWALIAIIKYWNVLPTWAKVLGLICILTPIGGPIFTLIIVYMGKESGNGSGNGSNISRFYGKRSSCY